MAGGTAKTPASKTLSILRTHHPSKGVSMAQLTNPVAINSHSSSNKAKGRGKERRLQSKAGLLESIKAAEAVVEGGL